MVQGLSYLWVRYRMRPLTDKWNQIVHWKLYHPLGDWQPTTKQNYRINLRIKLITSSRTRFQRARQRTPGIAPPIEFITTDPPPTSQPTDNNPLTNLQDRQRAPKQQISRCLENGTRIDLSLSEISDEEVDYDSYASNVDLDIASDDSWSAL